MARISIFSLIIVLAGYWLCTAGAIRHFIRPGVRAWNKIRKHRHHMKHHVVETLARPKDHHDHHDHHAAEKAEKDEEYSGNSAMRMVNFWGRALDIYGGYKIAQARIGFACALIRDPVEREKKAETWWEEVHEKNSDKMLKLCLELRGFYLKAGQFLGSRPDFMPMQYIYKLSTLHDRVPPIPESHVRRVIEEELDEPIDKVFSFLNLAHPVGAASICQVHEGKLRSNNEKVAVKVQYPGAEAVMRADLGNLRTLCSYLKKFELKFDLVSMITELQKQISQEFDFNQEADSLRAVGPSLEKAVSSVKVPRPYIATRRLLVMSFLEGTQITRLGELGYSKVPTVARKKLATGLLNKMAEAWGYMLFHTDLFHSDPHPGNILVMPGMKLGILDWGQTKKLDPKIRTGLARLFVAMGHNNQDEIVDQFYRLGIETSKRDNPEDIVRMVFSMFDTCQVADYCQNPFAKEHGLNQNAVLSFPSELCYVLRSVQIMRGMAQGMGVDYSLTRKWAPLAQELLTIERKAVSSE